MSKWVTLLPCPFCGHTTVKLKMEEESDEYETGFNVVCPFNDGGCGAASGYRGTVEEALEAWNRRAKGGE